jgi:hypothetical protein
MFAVFKPVRGTAVRRLRKTCRNKFVKMDYIMTILLSVTAYYGHDWPEQFFKQKRPVIDS